MLTNVDNQQINRTFQWDWEQQFAIMFNSQDSQRFMLVPVLLSAFAIPVSMIFWITNVIYSFFSPDSDNEGNLFTIFYLRFSVFLRKNFGTFHFFIMRRDLFVFNTTMIYSQKIKVSKCTIVMKQTFHSCFSFQVTLWSRLGDGLPLCLCPLLLHFLDWRKKVWISPERFWVNCKWRVLNH